MEQEEDKPYKIFFLFSGMGSLLLFNAILNFSLLFDNTIKGLYFYILFSFSFGSMVCFILIGLIGEAWSKYKILIIITLFQLFVFIFMILYTVSGPAPDWGMLIIVIAAFLAGIASSWFQSLSAGLAMETSSEAIKFFNFGTGLVGLLINIIMIVLNYFFPAADEKGYHFDMAYKQVYCFLPFFVLTLGLYLVSVWFYNKDVRRVTDLSNIKYQEIENNEVPNMNILKRSLDIEFGIFILLLTSVNLVAFLIVKAFQTFDEASGRSIAIFFLAYNLADTLSKIAPISWLPRNPLSIHLINLTKILLNVFFFVIIIGNVQNLLSSFYLRVALIVLNGLLNGMMTNALMIINSERFSKAKEKERAGYWNIFSLLLGVLCANLFGVLL